jgi:regulator of protease activity HflC (stomatin/prohibitin superfamily)
MRIAVVLAVAALVVLAWRTLRRTVVRDYQRGLLYRRGRLVRTLDAGVHWVFRPTSELIVIDIRSRLSTVAGQEVLSADNVAVRVSLALRFRVAQPAIAVVAVQSFADALYLEAQLVLRDLVAGLPVDDLLERRSQLGRNLRAGLEPQAAALGLELETVGVRDITFPASLKQTFAQVVEARKGALAALERARGETAALRHLANAARVLESNPGLATLRALQALDQGRNTVILGVGGPVLPGATVGGGSDRPQGGG